MTGPYYLDTATVEESVSEWMISKDGRTPMSCDIPGFYRAVIRRGDTPGWVFRFEERNRTCREALAMLNWPQSYSAERAA